MFIATYFDGGVTTPMGNVSAGWENWSTYANQGFKRLLQEYAQGRFPELEDTFQ